MIYFLLRFLLNTRAWPNRRNAFYCFVVVDIAPGKNLKTTWKRPTIKNFNFQSLLTAAAWFGLTLTWFKLKTERNILIYFYYKILFTYVHCTYSITLHKVLLRTLLCSLMNIEGLVKHAKKFSIQIKQNKRAQYESIVNCVYKILRRIPRFSFSVK